MKKIRGATNEALLRYQCDDISGILVNPSSAASIMRALAFQQTLKLSVALYNYSNGSYTQLDANALCKYHGINQAASSYQILPFHHGRVFKKYTAGQTIIDSPSKIASAVMQQMTV